MRKEDLDFFTGLGIDLDSGFGRDYNIFAISEGILIATTLRTKEMIVEFSKASWDEQKSLVPSLSDDHSGNTFGMACRLAISYLPQLKVEERDIKINEILD